MARGLRSKREKRNRAAIRDNRSAWRREQLDKILNSEDTPTMPVDTVMREEAKEVAAEIEEGSGTEEVAMGADSAAKPEPYIHFTHSEKKKLKKKMRNRSLEQRRKILNKVMKSTGKRR